MRLTLRIGQVLTSSLSSMPTIQNIKTSALSSYGAYRISRGLDEVFRPGCVYLSGHKIDETF